MPAFAGMTMAFWGASKALCQRLCAKAGAQGKNCRKRHRAFPGPRVKPGATIDTLADIAAQGSFPGYSIVLKLIAIISFWD
jgi:hypothetical protein